MKRSIIFGSVVISLGLLIALGPQFLFKVCKPSMATVIAEEEIDDCCAIPEKSGCCGPVISNFPVCHWSARAEMGIGLLIASLGICLIVFPDPKTRLGLFIGIFFAGIVAMFIPSTLIGGCAVKSMACHKGAFPALMVESILLVVYSVIMVFLIEIKRSSAS